MKIHVFFVSRIHPANSRHPKSAMHQSPVSCPGFPPHPQVLWPRQAFDVIDVIFSGWLLAQYSDI